jgi:hypothetical protein
MKTLFRLFLVLLLAVAVAYAVVKQNALAAARADQQTLRAESDEARRLARENKDLPQLRAVHEEVAKLLAENKDLPRLRNEVRQLRRQAGAVAALRAENQRLRSQQPASPDSVPAAFISRDTLADVGLGTPETAAQTYLWCLYTGNFKRLLDCCPTARILDTDEDWERNWRRDIQNRMKNFPGFRIVGREDISPDRVALTLETKFGGLRQTFTFFKQPDNSQWTFVDGPMSF